MISPQNLREGSPEPRDPHVLARVDGLTVSFPGGEGPAVNGVSFTIHSGECVALVGESGSGKSLTARALLGLLPSTAIVKGQILLGKHDRRCEHKQNEHREDNNAPTQDPPQGVLPALTPAPPPDSPAWNAIRGARSTLVPQDALGALDPLRRVELEVGDSLRLHRRATAVERRGHVVAALAAAGMPQPERHLRQRSDELSGGLRQRALIAAALIADPELIIADEPTTALDAKHRRRVLDELRRRVDGGAGALLISHDLASVRGIADRVLVMRNGRVVEHGETSRVLGSPKHPFTLELIAANPADRPRGTRLLEPSSSSGDPQSNSRSANLDPDALLPAEPPAAEIIIAVPAAIPVAAEVGGIANTRLELSEVTVTFGHGASTHRVLSGGSLSVSQGETVGLIGESGSGKTTLLRVALGLQGADSGEVFIDGIERATAARGVRRSLRRRIAFVPQDPLDSFPAGVNGRGLLADALRAAGVPRNLRAGRATDLAEEVGLTIAELMRPAATLSGGQRQRLAIARALALGPEILLLDEPVSALDVSVQARILDLLDGLQARHGTAYLLVSHDEDVIRHMSDRVLRLTDGHIINA